MMNSESEPEDEGAGRCESGNTVNLFQTFDIFNNSAANNSMHAVESTAPHSRQRSLWADMDVQDPPVPDAQPQAVPKAAATTTVDAAMSEDAFTTVMLRGLPKNLSQQTLTGLLDEMGFQGKYDFVYMAMDFKKSANLGYAFVNLCTPLEARSVKDQLQGLAWPGANGKVCNARWATQQGLQSLVELFRNSAVMHKTVPDWAKPVIYQGGVAVSFPLPTKMPKAPRCVPPNKQRRH